MGSTSIEAAKHVLLILGLILGAGICASFIARKLSLPDVAVFLLAGIVMGPAAAGWVHISTNTTLNQIILIFGASYILFDGGASLRLPVLKQVWFSIASLATIGVLITAFVTAMAAQIIFGMGFIHALLLASVIASTDPATLIPVFRQANIRARVAQTIMAESAFNDAVSAILTFSVLALAMHKGTFSLTASLLDLIRQLGLGLVAGFVLGWLAAALIAHERYAFLQDYAPVVTLVAVIAAYLGAEGLQASGFMAVFVFGIVIGNKDLLGFDMGHDEQRRLQEFVATTALLMRMFIFILLGSQVDFSLMRGCLREGLALVAVFMLIARPATVLLCVLPDRKAHWSWPEVLFMCWTRETGVIPGALAGLLMAMGAPDAALIGAVTFIAIVATILLQATTTRRLAEHLKLLD